uniref:hypothetical protein n=1 Tax=Paractinoplanes polyasparticus TaxID=2856853 RepID=UPI001C85F30F|nr:hypothetical protein [Actinoplanes polyasparticus]
MFDAQWEIPALPAAAALGTVFILGSWFFLHSRSHFTWPRLFTAWTACLYLLDVITVTMLPLQVAVGSYAVRIPWYEKGNLHPTRRH